jgi:hypothetical protein
LSFLHGDRFEEEDLEAVLKVGMKDPNELRVEVIDDKSNIIFSKIGTEII